MYSTASSDEMTVICCLPSQQKSKGVAATVSLVSIKTSEERRQLMGPPRTAPIKFNGYVYSRSLNAVVRVDEFYRFGKIRLQDHHYSRRRPLLEQSDLLAIPVDNSSEDRGLREQNRTLRCSH